jgi:hypothetical protein
VKRHSILSSIRSDVLYMAVSLLPSLAIGWRVLFLHQIPKSADSLNQSIPYYSFAREMIRGGELPLWNPFSSAGMPFLADPQTGVFYPLNLLHYFLPLDWSVLLLTFLPYPLAAVFVYLYLREIDGGPFEASISALGFTYSGYYLQYSYGMTLLHGMLWLPALFLFGERAVQRHSVGWASLTGLMWAVQVFSGHLQLAYYTLGATIAYLGFRAAAPLLKDWIRGRKPRFHDLLIPLTFGLFGPAFSTPQLLPAMEYIRMSNLARGYAAEAVGHLRYLPDLRILYGFQYAWAEAHMVYAGATCLLLAASALIVAPNRYTVFFSGLAASALILAFGERFVISDVLSHVVPGFAVIHVHWPTRILFLYMFSISVLAGQALRFRLSEQNKFLKRFLLVSIPVTLGGLIFFDPALTFLLKDEAPIIHLPPLVMFLSFAATAVIVVTLRQIEALSEAGFRLLLTILVFLELFYICRASRLIFCSFPSAISRPPSIDFLLGSQGGASIGTQSQAPRALGMDPDEKYGLDVKPEIMLSNLSTYYRIPDVQSYSPLSLQRYRQLVEATNERDWDYHLTVFGLENLRDHRVLDLLSVGYALVPTPYADELLKDAPDWKQVYSDPEATVLRNPHGFPRAFVAYDVMVLETDEEVLREVAEGSVDLRRTAVVKREEISSLDLSAVGSPKASTEATVMMHRDSPTRMQFQVSTPVEGVLIVSEAHYPAWQAQVDGEPRELFPVDYALQGVHIPKGSHQVRITFSGRSVLYGAIIFALSSACSAVLFVLEGHLIRRDRRLYSKRGNSREPDS